MGKVIILPETTKNPITLIGKRAGVCWNANISDDKMNYKRGMSCIESQHGRTLEYVNVEMIIDGYSARVIREYFTHLSGDPTRLQASTRYIDYSNFDYVAPKSIKYNKDSHVWEIFAKTIRTIQTSCKELEKYNIPREDIAMLLPLCMTTKIVDKRNLRNLVDMSHQRMCNRANWEFRELFNDISNALSGYSDEWEWIVNNLFEPKCKYLGYCPEHKGCGKVGKKYELRNSD